VPGVALSPLLIDVLRCPTDREPLLYIASEDTLYNPRLRRRYRVNDGIPGMLPDAFEAVDDTEHARLLSLPSVQTGSPA
jgi:uncharacterized protein